MPGLIPAFLIHFVDSPEKSGRFYSRLLGCLPVEESTTFVLFSFANGLNLGLWSRHTATPRPEVLGGGSEICFTVSSKEEVEELHDEWKQKGASILAPPYSMEKEGIKRCFVAEDLDGHRIRVMAMEGGA